MPMTCVLNFDFYRACAVSLRMIIRRMLEEGGGTHLPIRRVAVGGYLVPERHRLLSKNQYDKG